MGVLPSISDRIVPWENSVLVTNVDYTNIHYAVWSEAMPVPEVSAQGSVAAFGTLLALLAFLWERRRSSRLEDAALAA